MASNSQITGLDDGGRLLQKMIDNIDEDHAYYWALACSSFHTAIRDRLPNGTRTTSSAVLSSSERLIWTYTELPEEARHHGGELICVEWLLQLGN